MLYKCIQYNLSAPFLKVRFAYPNVLLYKSEYDTKTHKVANTIGLITKYGFLVDAFYMHFESTKQ